MGFWDNLVGRRINGHVEIAYGQHRLAALKESKIKEVDVIIKDLSDHQTLRIMANENLQIWKADINVIRETVRAALKELKKPGCWDKYPSMKKINNGKEIRQSIISEFLGGPWKRSYQIEQIKESLAQIKDIARGVIKEDHPKILPSLPKAQETRKAIWKTWSEDKVEEGKIQRVFKPPENKEAEEKRNRIIEEVIEEVVKNDLPINRVEGLMKSKVKMANYQQPTHGEFLQKLLMKFQIC